VTQLPPEDVKPATTFGFQPGVIMLLLVIYTFNYADRMIFASVGQSVKEELNLSDLQLGLLGGLAFAAFYTLFGLPLARLAERYNRVTIISICVAVWSAMTALCGTAQNYTQLLLFRMGVGIGEAGFTPTVVSLISDYFAPNRRASAYSVIILAVPLGSLIAAGLGSWLLPDHGWRIVFLVIGLPGVLLALLAKRYLKEPARGHSDGHLDVEPVPPLTEVVRYLARKPAFIHLTLGAALVGFVAYGNLNFLLPFLIRNFALSKAHAGLVLMLIMGVSATVGTLAGGFVSDWVGRRDLRWYAWLPAIGLTVAWPIYVYSLLQQSWLAAVIWMIIASCAFYAFLPATQTVTQGLVRSRMRASTSALHGLAAALIGMGTGPVFLGFVSDRLAQRRFDSPGATGDYAASCTAQSIAASPDLAAACTTASAYGVRYALVAASLALLWAALHYVRASRSLAREIISPYAGVQKPAGP
jgi:predicted MFS family arabinose efflux permease